VRVRVRVRGGSGRVRVRACIQSGNTALHSTVRARLKDSQKAAYARILIAAGIDTEIMNKVCCTIRVT
jgi:choline dehydrogenase-like flavoprotein